MASKREGGGDIEKGKGQRERGVEGERQREREESISSGACL